MSFIEDTFEAAHKVSMYKNPDLADFQDKLDAILEAAGLPCTGGEHISSMQLSEDTLYITTSWSVRCCDQESEYQIPLSILEAEDPLAAARIFKTSSRVAELRELAESHKKTLASTQAALDLVLSELKNLSGDI